MSLTRRNVLIGTGALVATSAIPAIAALPKPSSEPILFPCWGSPVFSFVEENTITTLYTRMSMWNFADQKFRILPIESVLYQDLIAIYPRDNPPHIHFGGAVVAGKGDPTFYPRWEERTRRHIANGKFDIIDSDHFTVRLDT
ncbi:hypothetical protein PHIM7_203 [Sinorhizobium phage phiM7]|uniref:Uncharacterized protein n=2 Tax=Emdodecavirus TaxID=1980937 RepID=S5MVH5_9CAUD|nr:hypothetical protein AB690_gp305 [Sinorhizobium phage phiM12]YP_009601328.1 hypothetical protein FDH46_gp275 [Sinorhizobium phage phiM7]AGR47902.2 hypothetical protein SmphiM12_270 [Sinorhizobium phage phiM12]AKF12748.1 hypothetical protein PHIM7_203 [Sinorhizobium phage phiM7]AKF13108.1 hypothetical protein PHIM19_203 [Sinorhizobium phage phiM19]